ncbi:ribosome-binding protein aMBF1 (putative translation factor) [Streptosporangium album]|uniref:Ribosome-binding protein aMBF1 (Putative translation factor) n=1 Tax=Streptosporangium album TaxID=47479 RepID=A0A7W7RUF3_9ACTN|nr:helix-turn-helix transcriptional regulator [Streptosporangium album]MBB4938434.1 ribosome-binding protein aMBF1 (putative translation factor) [Streptosporangium album]
MVGGRARSAAPRELTDNPDAWPHANLVGYPAAAIVQEIAATLASVLTERKLSLRGLAALSGVNRQAIADLLAGRSWPDVATIALLEAALGVRLWPTAPGDKRSSERAG